MTMGQQLQQAAGEEEAEGGPSETAAAAAVADTPRSHHSKSTPRWARSLAKQAQRGLAKFKEALQDPVGGDVR